jgi:hypothetical protein
MLHPPKRIAAEPCVSPLRHPNGPHDVRDVRTQAALSTCCVSDIDVAFVGPEFMKYVFVLVGCFLFVDTAHTSLHRLG